MSDKESTTKSPSDATAAEGHAAELEQLRGVMVEKEKIIDGLRSELSETRAAYY